MIKYKIIEVDEAQHSIVVRYYTDIITEEMLATDILDGIIRRCRTDYSIDLPIPAPTGAELDKFISLRAPIDWLTAQEAVKDPEINTTLDHIKSLINQETVASHSVLDNTATELYSPQLVDAVHKVLVDFNIIQAPI